MPNVDCGGLRNDLSFVVIVGGGSLKPSLRPSDDKPGGFMLKEFPTFQAIMIMGTANVLSLDNMGNTDKYTGVQVF